MKQPAVNLSRGSASHRITLEAPLTFANHLPFDITVGLPAIDRGSGNVRQDLRLPVQMVSFAIEEGKEEVVCDYPPHKEVTLQIQVSLYTCSPIVSQVIVVHVCTLSLFGKQWLLKYFRGAGQPQKLDTPMFIYMYNEHSVHLNFVGCHNLF